jgi:hypothetical protein
MTFVPKHSQSFVAFSFPSVNGAWDGVPPPMSLGERSSCRRCVFDALTGWASSCITPRGRGAPR